MGGREKYLGDTADVGPHTEEFGGANSNPISATQADAIGFTRADLPASLPAFLYPALIYLVFVNVCVMETAIVVWWRSKGLALHPASPFL